MPAIMQAAQDMALSDPARAILEPRDSPRAAVERVLAAGHGEAALMLTARLLPLSYALAWGCQHARRRLPAGDALHGVECAEQWLREPNETHRRQAQALARKDRYRSVGAWLAAAVAWSGGDLAPAGQTRAVPPAHLSAVAIAAAMALLAACGEGDFASSRQALIESALGLLDPLPADEES